MSHTTLVFAILFAASPADAQKSGDSPVKKVQDVLPLPEIDIQGYFICKGQEVGGKSYTGVAVITRKNDVYVVQWVIGSGSTFTGIGIRQGNTLATSWAIPGERGIVRGVNIYRIDVTSTGPRLVGRWASLPGPGALQSETLTFLKNSDEEE